MTYPPPIQVLDQIEQLREHVLHALCLQIEALPDNPRIQRLNSQAMVIKSSDLQHNWSVEHHDFKKCYQLITEHLRKQSKSKFAACLKSIIRNKRVDVTRGYSVQLHPDVVAHLERVYRGEPCQQQSSMKRLSAAKPAQLLASS